MKPHWHVLRTCRAAGSPWLPYVPEVLPVSSHIFSSNGNSNLVEEKPQHPMRVKNGELLERESQLGVLAWYPDTFDFLGRKRAHSDAICGCNQSSTPQSTIFQKSRVSFFPLFIPKRKVFQWTCWPLSSELNEVIYRCQGSFTWFLMRFITFLMEDASEKAPGPGKIGVKSHPKPHLQSDLPKRKAPRHMHSQHLPRKDLRCVSS